MSHQQIINKPVLAPRGERLVCSAPGWRDEIAITEVARCQIYNALEAQSFWCEVKVEWDKLAVNGDEWRVPCSSGIPFVGPVVHFDVAMRPVAPDNAIELYIPADSLRETDTSVARIMRIDLLPGFTAAHAGEEGYLFVPSLAGTLHRFNHRVSRECRIGIYSPHEQWAYKSHVNCFGMHREGQSSWCAIFTEGEFDAEAVLRSHYEEDAGYSMHPGFVYRWQPGEELYRETKSVRFYFFAPEEGGWAAFARSYRRFLREERRVRTWAEKQDDHPWVMPFATGFLMKIMQGVKVSTLDGKGAYQSATSFAEARDILARMQSEGIIHITAQMVGWNWEGHDGRYPARFPVNEVEGGEAEFRKPHRLGER